MALPKSSKLPSPARAYVILECISAWMATLKQKQKYYSSIANSSSKSILKCPLNQCKAAVIYSTIYLPTITYPFPATTLPNMTLEKAQSMTSPLILSKMGYNRNMPKTVVYAPATHRGLGMTHLPMEQGLQKVLQVIKHL